MTGLLNITFLFVGFLLNLTVCQDMDACFEEALRFVYEEILEEEYRPEMFGVIDSNSVNETKKVESFVVTKTIVRPKRAAEGNSFNMVKPPENLEPYFLTDIVRHFGQSQALIFTNQSTLKGDPSYWNWNCS